MRKNIKGLKITWDDFDQLCKDLSLNINKKYNPDIIVGIVKAGVIPGAVIASLFRKDFYTIKISRRKDEKKIRDKPHLFVPVTDSVHGKKVLIVDEMSITGQTLSLAREHILSKLAHEVRTCALFVTSGCPKPDWFAIETDEKIIAPWDYCVIKGEKISINPDYL